MRTNLDMMRTDVTFIFTKINMSKVQKYEPLILRNLKIIVMNFSFETIESRLVKTF